MSACVPGVCLMSKEARRRMLDPLRLEWVVSHLTGCCELNSGLLFLKSFKYS